MGVHVSIVQYLPNESKRGAIVLELSFNDADRLVSVAHALSTRSRVDMLQLLSENNMNVVELAESLQLPVSTVANHVRILEAAGLIRSELLPATRGAMKVCSPNYEEIHIGFNTKTLAPEGTSMEYRVEVPIGHYSDCEVYPTCGMASLEKVFEPEDEPASFYHPKHVDASLIWFRKGFVEYLLPLELPAGAKIEALEFSLELCSEAPMFDNNWPSDITLWVNGQEVSTWTSPGDFGGRRGKLNPVWWRDSATQYGLLKTWTMNGEHTTLDNEKVSDITIHDLNLMHRPRVQLRIGVKEDAVNKGGINLLGRGFGDYDQDLVMKVRYSVE